MHFWIDKRSQACGFGRARVAASLSGGGGLGFGHPRRIPRKSMVTPIHRFQTVDCTRPHLYRQQQQQQQQSQQQQSHPQNSSHNQHYHQQHHQQQTSSNNQPHIQHHQAQLHSSGHYNQHNSILLPSTHHSQTSSQGQHLHQQQHQQAQQHANSYHVPVTVNHIYSNSSSQPNAIEIDQSSVGIGTLNQHVPHVGHDAQLLPAHLKCGMWASLALATVFVAGAKFYFDHQGTGLEVLIFCAFSATFFLAACTVSLCRRPRDLQIPANNVISETISNGEQNSLQNNLDLVNNTPSPLLNGSVGGTQPSSLAVLAPPPPYHIAILLPESTKETDESPPPSYDKIVI